MTDVHIPADLWNDDSQGAVSVWFFEAGDRVNQGDALCEVMVEKSTFEIAAPASGVLTIVAEVEEPVNRGALIARIG